MNINNEVKLAVEKKAAEIEQANKEEMIQSAVNADLAACRSDFAASVTSMIPTVTEWTKQNPDKTAADFPRPSFVGSNSVNIAPAVPALASRHAHALAPAPSAAHSSSSSVSGMLCGASTLAELDALTIITPFYNISLFRCLLDV